MKLLNFIRFINAFTLPYFVVISSGWVQIFFSVVIIINLLEHAAIKAEKGV